MDVCMPSENPADFDYMHGFLFVRRDGTCVIINHCLLCIRFHKNVCRDGAAQVQLQNSPGVHESTGGQQNNITSIARLIFFSLWSRIRYGLQAC